MTPVDLFWNRCEGPLVYGVNDCCMVVADVVVAAGGPDLMADYRGRYRTRLGFIRAFRKAGHTSLAEAATAMLAATGERVENPRDFDVAVVTYLDTGEKVTSPAFYHSGYWCLRSERGAVCSEGSPEQIWRIYA